jgi:hypothetical protein
MPLPLAEFGKVAAGPPDFELPPAVLPAFCATASVPVRANAAARRIVFKFMVVSSGGLWPRKEIEVKVLGSYFFRMPVSVLLRLFTALLAAGVFTAGDGDDPVPGPVWFAPRLFPVVPWFRALDVFEPGEPPVPLIVLPFESVFPAEPLPAPELAAPPAAPPELPPELCARVKDVLPSSRLRITANNFMGIPLCVGETPMADSSDSSGSRDPTRAVRQAGLRCRRAPKFARAIARSRLLCWKPPKPLRRALL